MFNTSFFIFSGRRTTWFAAGLQNNPLSVEASKDSEKRKRIEEFQPHGRKAHPLGGLHPEKPHPGPAIILETICAVPCEPIEMVKLQFHCGIRSVVYAHREAYRKDRFLMDMNAHWHVRNAFIRYGLLLVHVEPEWYLLRRWTHDPRGGGGSITHTPKL